MNDDPIVPTEAALVFFAVEIRNEPHGGISPSTLDSAIDSFEQAPNNLQSEWAGESDASDFAAHLEALRDQEGGGAELEDLIFAAQSGPISKS